jgi:hypothetical protein
MSNTLYQQLVHLLALVAVACLTGFGRIDQSTGLALLGGLVGIALPSPFQPQPALPKPGA